MHVLEQNAVDQHLIVSTTSLVYGSLEEFDDRVIETNGDLRLPRIGRHDRSPLRAREIDVAISLSDDLSHMGAECIDKWLPLQKAGHSLTVWTTRWTTRGFHHARVRYRVTASSHARHARSRESACGSNVRCSERPSTSARITAPASSGLTRRKTPARMPCATVAPSVRRRR